MKTLGRPPKPEIERFLNKVLLIPEHPCWEWTASKDKDGYGKFDKGRSHRFSYSFYKGPLSSGLVIDHICRNRGCVNPNHLRQVTTRQNSIENSVGITAKNSQKTICSKGHLLTPENTYRDKRQRHCRECLRIKWRKKYARTKNKLTT